MSDLKDIKDRLRDESKIERLLEAMGCEHIKAEQKGMLITAQLPERFGSNNRRAVQVRLNENLTSRIRNRNFKGDIFSLVSYIHHDKREDIEKDLYNAKKFICNLFGWNQFLKGSVGDVVVKDYTASLKAIIGEKKKKVEIKPNPIIPEKTMNQFYFYGKPLPYKNWIEEGISYEIQELYGVGFDLESKRVVFPIRNRHGQLIGVKGRAVDDDVDPKYIYLYRCNISQEWFNLHYALPYILMEKKVIIVESEKSCMKFASLGIWNTLAICSSDITNEQVEILKGLGMDIEIILAYDKDKTVKEIKSQAEKFEGRKVYGIVDTENLLGEKDAPIDKGLEVWNKLYNDCCYEIF